MLLHTHLATWKTHEGKDSADIFITITRRREISSQYSIGPVKKKKGLFLMEANILYQTTLTQ